MYGLIENNCATAVRKPVKLAFKTVASQTAPFRIPVNAAHVAVGVWPALKAKLNTVRQ